MAFEPPDGGVPEHVLELALGLPRHGWEVEVAGPPEATIYPRLTEAGVPLHRIPNLRRGYRAPWRDIGAARSMRRLLREERFGIVHCHAGKAGLLGRRLANRVGAGVVYSPHCFGFVGEVGLPRRIGVTAVERRLARITDMLICVCEAELRLAESRRIGAAEKRRCIHNGCPPCGPAEAPPRDFARWAEGRPVVGTVAVLRRQKGLDTLLAAAPQIVAAHPQAGVAIIGDGPEQANLRRRAAGLDLPGESVRFFPFVAPPSRYLRSLAVCVQTSAWEAFPIAILEALACGVPQVVTDVGGTREAVSEETGVLVPPRDPETLARAVLALLEDGERRSRMAAAAVARHQQLFRTEQMCAKTAKVYDSLVA